VICALWTLHFHSGIFFNPIPIYAAGPICESGTVSSETNRHSLPQTVRTGRTRCEFRYSYHESSALQSWTSYTSSMSLSSRSKNPRWLDSDCEFCNARNITIVATKRIEV
jgi:hypothetical protein